MEEPSQSCRLSTCLVEFLDVKKFPYFFGQFEPDTKSSPTPSNVINVDEREQLFHSVSIVCTLLLQIGEVGQNVKLKRSTTVEACGDVLEKVQDIFSFTSQAIIYNVHNPFCFKPG